MTRNVQRVLHCPCGNHKVLALGLCSTCYTLKRQDDEYFGGLREAVLERDGYRCRVCDASGRDKRSIIVHHRVPGRSVMNLMLSLCPGCHAKIHRTKAALSAMPPLLLALWREQHPKGHEQVQLDYTSKKAAAKLVLLFNESEPSQYVDLRVISKSRRYRRFFPKWYTRRLSLEDRSILMRCVRDRTDSKMPLSSAGLELTLDGLQDALFVLNKEWLIVYANRQAETMLRMSAEQLLGSSQWTVFPESSTSLVGSLYREAVATGEAKRFEFFYELANTWFEVNACPSLIGLTVTFRDITENKKTTAALMQSEKLAAVGRLASSMAHEINNPLEAITNLLYLSRQAATSLNLKDWLDQADLELRRVSVIANQTLRFHRQSSRPQSITCLSLFSATLSLHEARLKNASILVEKRKRANEPVEIFEGDIRQVLSNIVTNAIDAMPTGGRLIVRSREGTDWSTGRTGLVLTLADTGIGMDYETRCRMFEAFYTTKGIGGSGLGLWISADIMQRHEGRITIRSSQLPGTTGTVVVLFLPFEAAAKAGLVTAEQAMLA